MHVGLARNIRCRKKSRSVFNAFAENPGGELRDACQGLFRDLPMRRVAHAVQHRSLDRAIAFLLDDAHLRERAVRIGRALHDQHRHADVGERLGGVERRKSRVEPRAAPAAERRVDIRMMPREPRAQVGRLERLDRLPDPAMLLASMKKCGAISTSPRTRWSCTLPA